MVSPPPVPPRLLAALGLGAVAVALAVGGPYWPLVVFAGFLVLAASAYSKTDGWTLFGPLAGWSLVRAARRGRPFTARVLAGVGVLILCCGVFRLGFWEQSTDPAAILSPSELTTLCRLAFGWLLGVVVVFAALRVGFTLPAIIAEEREMKRLDHLLVTDLRSHEILIGRTLVLAAPLLAEVAVPIPVLVLLAAHGGVDLHIPLAAAVLGAGLAMGTLGLAVGCSARAKRVTTATFHTLHAAVWLFAFTLAASFVAGRVPLEVGQALDVFAIGNPFLFGWVGFNAWNSPTPVADMDRTIRRYLLWHLVLLVIGWRAAVRALRPVPVRRPVPTPATPVVKLPTRYSVQWPWWLTPLVVAVVLLLIQAYSFVSFWNNEIISGLVGWSGLFAFALVTVPVGFAAVRQLPWERQHQTMDGLLLTALSPSEIVLRAWRAGLVSAPGRVAGLAVLLGWGWAVGAVSRAGVLGIVLNSTANALLAASVGVLVSVPFGTVRRASALFLLVGLYWTGGWVGWYISDDGPNPGRRMMVAVPPVAQAVSPIEYRGGVYRPNPWRLFSVGTTATGVDEIRKAVWRNTIGSAALAGLFLAMACGWFHRRVRPRVEEMPPP